MKSLYTTLALLFAAAFLLVGGVLVLVTQTMFDRARLIELSTDLMIGGLVFAALAALCVYRLITCHLQRLAAAVESIAAGALAMPLRIEGADPEGDEIDRLATHVERLSERIARQLADLERAAQRRGELLANVSHDLRTPLASMQGYLELLLLRHGSLAPAEERNYLETAVRHSERLSRLVGDLFELTRLEADEAQPQFEEFAPAELAQDVAQKFALDADRRGVSLQTSCDERCAGLRVHADIGMVERVFENLLDNALRHTLAGGAVTIELGCVTHRARLAVRDTGPGIAAARLPTLFDRYERADRSAPGGPGGLGLAIARHIVQLHGGVLAVQSTLGAGSCFSFDLALAKRSTLATTADAERMT